MNQLLNHCKSIKNTIVKLILNVQALVNENMLSYFNYKIIRFFMILPDFVKFKFKLLEKKNADKQILIFLH